MYLLTTQPRFVRRPTSCPAPPRPAAWSACPARRLPPRRWCHERRPDSTGDHNDPSWRRLAGSFAAFVDILHFTVVRHKAQCAEGQPKSKEAGGILVFLVHLLGLK